MIPELNRPANLWRHLNYTRFCFEIQGIGESTNEADTMDQLNRLAQRYTDHLTYYEMKAKRAHVLYKIGPNRVVADG